MWPMSVELDTAPRRQLLIRPGTQIMAVTCTALTGERFRRREEVPGSPGDGIDHLPARVCNKRDQAARASFPGLG